MGPPPDSQPRIAAALERIAEALEAIAVYAGTVADADVLTSEARDAIYSDQISQSPQRPKSSRRKPLRAFGTSAFFARES
jgi:hypothetical protein